MKISVIIPTYKPQEYMWECLGSLVAQTFPKDDFEVILVLNGCNEPYYTLIRNYLVDNSSLHVNLIQTDEGGVSNARNIALDVAKGEYVTFIDDDDYVSSTYLEELYAKVSPDTISLCYPYAFNDGEPEKQLAYPITSVFEKLSPIGKQKYPRARKYFSGPCMKLIPMSFIQGRNFDKRFKNGEDSLFMFLVSDKFKYVNFTSPNAVYYRRYRKNSAIMSEYTKLYLIKSRLQLMWAYTGIYFSSPLKYSFSLYLMRLLGTINGLKWLLSHSK